MKLFLTRHGETNENAAGIIQGHFEGTLSSKGIAQAQKLAEHLKNEYFDAVYCSDLIRAKDTAAAIIQYHPNTDIIYTQQLRERNLGEFQGRKKTDIGAGSGNISFMPVKEGESLTALYSRADAFISDLLSKHVSESVLLVGHSVFSLALITRIKGEPPAAMQHQSKVSNTSVTEFIFENQSNIEQYGEANLVRYNDTTHL